jgi:predicted flap endonuclease-1-like 5' DNA nuclease
MSSLPAIRLESPAYLGGRPTIFQQLGDRSSAGHHSMSLHVSKLRGITVIMRRKLKRQGITYTDQLLAAGGPAELRRRLAGATDIDEDALTRLVERADLARIKGIGAIFADMLNWLGVDRVSDLAGRDPADLHHELQALNAVERFARRAPTPNEVRDWVSQARALPPTMDG